MHKLTALLFALGLTVLLLGLAAQLPLGAPPMGVGAEVLQRTPTEIGSANIVTAVVLAYRGIDTLGELAILFAAASVAGMVLAPAGAAGKARSPAGLVLRAGSDLLFPLLLVVGFYIVTHGHLTPGGGFQGGVVLAAAFFVSRLARPSPNSKLKIQNSKLKIKNSGPAGVMWLEALAGAAFIGIGLMAMLDGGPFLRLLLDTGVVGQLVSAGSLPLLYLAVGLKVGAELADLLAHLAE